MACEVAPHALRAVASHAVCERERRRSPRSITGTRYVDFPTPVRIARPMHRRRLFIKTRSLFLAALLLVPLLSSGHHHAADAATQGACAMCVVAHHTPAVVAAAPATLTPSVMRLTALSAPLVAPTQRVHSPIAGRAPPFSSPLATS